MFSVCNIEVFVVLRIFEFIVVSMEISVVRIWCCVVWGFGWYVLVFGIVIFISFVIYFFFWCFFVFFCVCIFIICKYLVYILIKKLFGKIKEEDLECY